MPTIFSGKETASIDGSRSGLVCGASGECGISDGLLFHK